MIRLYYKGKATKQLTEIDKMRDGAWIIAERPDEEEQQYLVNELGLDAGLIQDALDPNEVPRIEQDEGVSYMFTRVPYTSNGQVETTPVLVAIGPNFVIIITQRSLDTWKRLITGKVSINTTQKTKLFLLIFSEITRSYQQNLNSINRGVRAVSVKLERITNQNIIAFVQFERTLNDFIGALIPTNGSLEQIVAGKVFRLYEDDREVTEDLSLSAEQLIEVAKSNLRMIVNVRNAYSTIMTNNLNRVIKLLTTITIVLTVPTMLAGLFGMNVLLPFSADEPRSFWVIIAITVAASLFVYILASRRE